MTFTGMPVEDLLDHGWLAHIHPDDVEPCQSSYLPAVAARQPFQLEYRLRRADGAYRWLLDTGVPKYDANGDFGGYVGSAIDISERREMEQSIVHAQAALQQTLEQNQDLAGRLIHAQEAERGRIARDLHDDVSQQIAAVSIMLSTLRRTVGLAGEQPTGRAHAHRAPGSCHVARRRHPASFPRIASERAAACRAGGHVAAPLRRDRPASAD